MDDSNTTESHSVQLANALFDASLCSNVDEAQGIAEAIVEDVASKYGEFSHLSFREAYVSELEDYFAISKEEAMVLVKKTFFILDDYNDCGSLEDDESSTISISQPSEDDESENNEQEILIGDGECELCERYIQLSRHHLIPKSTHSKIKPRLAHALEALQKGDLHKAKTVLGDGLEYIIPLLSKNANDSLTPASLFRSILGTTCNVCRPCHSAIHKAHDNVTLAVEYSTVEKLLSDENIYKFSKWASKQRPGKYAVR
mmetsp:Transcript_19080/g.29383  ORF Transcript_19080/g.29383 Transcript_19080/m.29383 type:complete len:258 (-) Transcript_19080:54-827(-)|eukprot:CAMPEP_0195282648 /NCGR_PEP_ID=MMETSP0707-20130614/1440_1 /TAXON_ID=33640 /ORGANISM="Asterionellopsis glacialis, Strain CCMP134" /LENGTH=257 /DNA_ID=CAMNT_0040341651 /DNA_START=136 /DNA_END=909 /DNA_ORIENTATION=+